MWSLENVLTKLKNSGHLPDGFKPTNGIRSLFPAGESISITALNDYVYDSKGTVALGTADVTGNFEVQADGAGRWAFTWSNKTTETGWSTVNFRIRSGFVFLFSQDTTGRGYVDSSGSINAPSCNSGTDAWISDNWPKAFAAGARVTMQDATGFNSLPEESGIWTDAGFAQFVSLNGSNVPCPDLEQTPFPWEGGGDDDG
jgi:hypothetical protein